MRAGGWVCMTQHRHHRQRLLLMPVDLPAHPSHHLPAPTSQVYASYKYDRQLGSAAALPHDHPSYLEARSLQEGEAHALAAAPGAAGTPPSRVPLSQVAPPQPQQPLSIDSARYGHTHNYMGAQARPQQQRQQPKPSTSEGAPSDKGAAEAVGGGGSGGGEEACSTGPASHGAWQPGQSVDVHPPDMKQAVAWQLGWRSMQAQLTQKATKAAAKDTGAAEVRDVHVSLSVHRRRVRLVYLPVYIAHYQHGYRCGADAAVLLRGGGYAFGGSCLP